jgi:hypothetical protein
VAAEDQLLDRQPGSLIEGGDFLHFRSWSQLSGRICFVYERHCREITITWNHFLTGNNSNLDTRRHIAGVLARQKEAEEQLRDYDEQRRREEEERKRKEGEARIAEQKRKREEARLAAEKANLEREKAALSLQKTEQDRKNLEAQRLAAAPKSAQNSVDLGNGRKRQEIVIQTPYTAPERLTYIEWAPGSPPPTPKECLENAIKFGEIFLKLMEVRASDSLLFEATLSPTVKNDWTLASRVPRNFTVKHHHVDLQDNLVAEITAQGIDVDKRDRFTQKITIKAQEGKIPFQVQNIQVQSDPLGWEQTARDTRHTCLLKLEQISAQSCSSCSVGGVWLGYSCPWHSFMVHVDCLLQVDLPMLDADPTLWTWDIMQAERAGP